MTGLDLSLTGTGAVRIDTQRREIVERALFTSKPPTAVPSPSSRTKKPKMIQLLWDRALRLNRLQRDIVNFAQLSDLVVFEAPSFGSVGGHKHDRSGLFYMIAGEVLATICPIAEVPPTTLKLYVTGDGGADKSQMIATLNREWPSLSSRNDNVVDAAGLALMAARAMGEPVDIDASWKTRAMSSVLWPENTRERTA